MRSWIRGFRMPDEGLSATLEIAHPPSIVAEPPRMGLRQGRFSRFRLLRANRLVLIGIVLTLLIVLATLLANFLAPYDPIALNARHRLEPPSSEFRFGTDRLGRDVLSRVVYGARSSLGIAASSVAIALILGSALGLAAGFFG